MLNILSFKDLPIRMILVFDFSQENVYVPIHILSALAIGCCMVGSAYMAPSYQCVRNFWE